MSSMDEALMLLKLRGPQTAQALAGLLGLSSMGVRRQLEAALGKQLVAFADSPGKVGRPVRRWRLTDAGHARFPDRHAQLSVELIGQVRSLFGEAGLDRLVEARAAAGEAACRAEVEAAPTLPDRVAALARVRDREGYMAASEVQSDGSILLAQHHCPIREAACACQAFCRTELELFQRVLGPSVSVLRTEHQLAGGRRCAYRIAAATAPA